MTLAFARCAGEIGAVRDVSEARVPGPATAPRISQVAVAADIVGAQGTDDNALFGHSIAVGDFDGDGRADIAAGMPGTSSRRGAVAIIYSDERGMNLKSPDLFNRSRLAEMALTGAGGDHEGDQFGYAVAAGDFDNDGFADLAIGAPFRAAGEQPDAGEVFVVYGTREKGPAGLIARSQRFTQSGAGRNQAGDHFGMSLAVGDFNGDGYHDIAIGAPDEDDEANGRRNSGAVFIRYGSARGLTSDGYHFITAATRSPTTGESSTEADERFGLDLVAGQLHTNPYRHSDDLVVGAPGKDVRVHSASAGARDLIYRDCGQVYVYQATTEHQLTHWFDLIPGLVPSGVVGFGSSLAIGDFDRDQHADLAIGAPEAGEVNGESGGKIFILMYNAAENALGQRALPEVRGTDYYRRADKALTQAPIAKMENGDQHGFSLAAADFDGDGFTDLAAGAPGDDWNRSVDAGLVFLSLGSSAGLSSKYGCTYSFLDQAPRGGNEAGDRFGFAIARGAYVRPGGRQVTIDGDELPDLVIGAPYENRPGAVNGGAVFLGRTRTVSSGPLDGVWTGTITGDESSATATVSLCDREGRVAGPASLDATLRITACGRTIGLGRFANVGAAKASPDSRRAKGSLTGFRLPDDVRGAALIVLEVSADGSSASGTILIRDVQVKLPEIGWQSPGPCADVDIPVALTKVR